MSSRLGKEPGLLLLDEDFPAFSVGGVDQRGERAVSVEAVRVAEATQAQLYNIHAGIVANMESNDLNAEPCFFALYEASLEGEGGVLSEGSLFLNWVNSWIRPEYEFEQIILDLSVVLACERGDVLLKLFGGADALPLSDEEARRIICFRQKMSNQFRDYDFGQHLARRSRSNKDGCESYLRRNSLFNKWLKLWFDFSHATEVRGVPVILERGISLELRPFDSHLEYRDLQRILGGSMQMAYGKIDGEIPVGDAELTKLVEMKQHFESLSELDGEARGVALYDLSISHNERLVSHSRFMQWVCSSMSWSAIAGALRMSKNDAGERSARYYLMGHYPLTREQALAIVRKHPLVTAQSKSLWFRDSSPSISLPAGPRTTW